MPHISLAEDLGKSVNNAIADWFSGKASVVGQTIGVTPTPKLNTSNVPSFQAPSAPQTPAAMVQWTPDWLKEVDTHVRAQFDLDAAAARANASSSNSPPSGAGSGNDDAATKENIGALVAVGFVALAAGMLVMAAAKK